MPDIPLWILIPAGLLAWLAGMAILFGMINEFLTRGPESDEERKDAD
ncbi:hypothetical protein [Actomonas aquatica]|uniref:Uncharacterized protein n=1 Tax=Actomonas aquatica TaxID=2866162 RepID=A0ABZ1CCW2_9BACT|nr:hypothetical protein [Opitutus sp. WL0086]WRQ89389.1 hypothetical protein K1X11_008205 [Opitutus sp. WL0086]